MLTSVLAFDVSTSIVGVSVLDKDILSDGFSVLHLDFIDLKKCETIFEKAQVVSDYVDNKLLAFKPGKIAIEEPLMSFKPGFSSAKTITTLFRFNGMVSLISMQKFGIEPIYVSASHARKVCGLKMQQKKKCGKSHKDQTFEAIMSTDLKDHVWPSKKSGNIVDGAKDAVDAYVICKAACLE